jgi:putative hydrolase of the HAD superfamily
VGRFGIDAIVDLIVISAEEGVAKPDPAIYLLTCRRLGLAPAECLFFDDTPANVEGARRAGLHAELFSTVPQLVATVAHLASDGRGPV